MIHPTSSISHQVATSRWMSGGIACVAAIVMGLTLLAPPATAADLDDEPQSQPSLSTVAPQPSTEPSSPAPTTSSPSSVPPPAAVEPSISPISPSLSTPTSQADGAMPDYPLDVSALKPQGPGAAMGSGGIPRTISTPFAATSLSAADEKPAGTESMQSGFDVSGHQPVVNWTSAWNNGARFAFIKASEGPWPMNDYFSQQYNGATSAGLIRGAYSFGRPDISGGASQAKTLVQSGGGWSADGRTLPGVLDLENYVGLPACYGLSAAQLINWTRDFTSTYLSMTGRDAIIYVNYSFWNSCMGSTTAFGSENPIWVAAYGPSLGNLLIPGGWKQFTFWQYAHSGTYPGDQNVFNGDYRQLQNLAGATPTSASSSITSQAASNPRLKAPITGVICGLTNGGCYQGFQGGTVHHSPASGAHATWGGIRSKWGSLGYENGKLGYPITNEICGLAKDGCYQGFQGGTIHYSPASGTHATRGSVRSLWGVLGYENSSLGYPVTDEICGLSDDGCYQAFLGGKIHYSPSSGTYATWGGIGGKWGSLGYENGKLGYPITKEICGLTEGGCYQGFQGGTIHYSPGVGAYAAWGAMRDIWGSFGFENGKLGYPVTNEICGLAKAGCYQGFQGGTIHYSPSSGTHATWGGIRDKWGSLGYENGRLSYPLTNEICGQANGGCYQTFQGGRVRYSPASGTTVSFN